MGRHSAPDDPDEDVDLDARTVDAGPRTALATRPSTATESDGRHAHRGGARPRPTPEADASAAVDSDLADGTAEPDGDGPPTEGLSLLDDAFGPEPVDGPDPADELVGAAAFVDDGAARLGPKGPAPAPADHAAADAPTTKIALAALARDDRAVPEETTAKIAPVTGPTASTDPDAPAGPVTPTTAAPAAAAPGTAAVPAARSGHATSADLALIRRHGDVRARVVAAVIAPFVVFVAVFAVRDNLEVHSLIWIWIPAVVAGVLVGFLLDAGHKRYAGDQE